MLAGGETVLVAVSGRRRLRRAARRPRASWPPRSRLGCTSSTCDHGLRAEADRTPSSSARSPRGSALPLTWSASASGRRARRGRARGGGAPRPLRRARGAGHAHRRRPHRRRPHRGRPGRDRADAPARRRGRARPRRDRARARADHPPADRDAAAPTSWRTSPRRGLDWVEDATNRDPKLPAQSHPPRRAAVPGRGLRTRRGRPRSCRSAPRGRAPLRRRPRAAARARARARSAARGPARIVFARRRPARRCPRELAAEVLRQAAAGLGGCAAAARAPAHRARPAPRAPRSAAPRASARAAA